MDSRAACHPPANPFSIYEAAFVKGPVQGIWWRSSRTLPLAVGVGRFVPSQPGPERVGLCLLRHSLLSPSRSAAMTWHSMPSHAQGDGSQMVSSRSRLRVLAFIATGAIIAAYGVFLLLMDQGSVHDWIDVENSLKLRQICGWWAAFGATAWVVATFGAGPALCSALTRLRGCFRPLLFATILLTSIVYASSP